MSKDKPKYPELFHTAEQEEYAAAYILQYVVDGVFISYWFYDDSVT